MTNAEWRLDIQLELTHCEDPTKNDYSFFAFSNRHISSFELGKLWKNLVRERSDLNETRSGRFGIRIYVIVPDWKEELDQLMPLKRNSKSGYTSARHLDDQELSECRDSPPGGLVDTIRKFRAEALELIQYRNGLLFQLRRRLLQDGLFSAKAVAHYRGSQLSWILTFLAEEERYPFITV